MNWLDILIAAVVAASVISAVVKGLTHEVVSLAAAVVGFLVALWSYPAMARRFDSYTSTPAVAGFVGFLVIFIGFLVAGWLLSKILVKLLKASGLRWFDRLLGSAFGLARGVLVAAAVVVALVAFAPGKGPIEAVAGSRLAPSVLYCAGVIVTIAPRKLKDSFQEGLERVRRIWRQTPETV